MCVIGSFAKGLADAICQSKQANAQADVSCGARRGHRCLTFILYCKPTKTSILPPSCHDRRSAMLFAWHGLRTNELRSGGWLSQAHLRANELTGALARHELSSFVRKGFPSRRC